MILAVILLITGIAAIILEFFVPAFGLIGVIGGGTIIASIITAFRISSLAGSVFLIAALIIVPVLMILFFRVFPKTFIGKKLILHRSFDSEDGFQSTAADYTELTGTECEAVSDLRPAGTIFADGKKLSAVTAGEYIEKGTTVRVVKTEGNKITVAEVEKC